jgi:hypothetical protein
MILKIVLYEPLTQIQVKVGVALLLAVYRELRVVRLGAKPLETHDQSNFFQLNPCGHSPYVTSLTRRWVTQAASTASAQIA